jgi:hypothetical protein
MSSGRSIIGPAGGFQGFLVMLIGIAGQYVLFERILNGRGRDVGEIGRKLPGFFGLALVTYLAVGFATMWFLIPGLILGARWLLCPSVYATDEEGIFASIGKSWNLVRGNTVIVSVVLAVCILGVLLLGSMLTAAGGFVDDVIGSGRLLRNVGASILAECFTLTLLSLSIGTFELLRPEEEEITRVFS